MKPVSSPLQRTPWWDRFAVVLILGGFFAVGVIVGFVLGVTVAL